MGDHSVVLCCNEYIARHCCAIMCAPQHCTYMYCHLLVRTNDQFHNNSDISVAIQPPSSANVVIYCWAVQRTLLVEYRLYSLPKSFSGLLF